MIDLHCRYCHSSVTLREAVRIASAEPLKAAVFCDSCWRRLGTLGDALRFLDTKAQKESQPCP